MAKVTGPLMSQDASGTLAGEIRFRHHAGQVVVYRNGAPGSVRPCPPSAAQAQVRSRFREARERWRALTPTQRRNWENHARSRAAGLSAWNCFLSCVLRGGAWGGGDAAPPPLTEPVTLLSPYAPPPLAQVLLLAEG
jgi:hypothetical protein